MRARFLLAVAFGAVLASGVAAQSGPDNDPSQAQGYVRNYFHHSSVDSINLYNGQLTVPVAIGPVYQIGPKLAFQATLTYNTAVTEPGHPTDENNPNYYPVIGDPALGVGWTFTAGKIACGALPTSPPNGNFARPPCYMRPDGAQIDFYGGPTEYTTLDGSQYRLVRNGAAPNLTYTLRDGDGNRYDFTWAVTGYDDDPFTSPGYARDFGRARDGYYLTSMQDPFGNRLSVTYAANGTNPCPFTCALPTSMRCGGTALRSWIPATFSIQRAGEAARQIGQVLTDPATLRIQSLRFKTLRGGASQYSQWDLSYGAVVLTSRSASLYCAASLSTLTRIALPDDVLNTAGYRFDYYETGAGQALLKAMTLPTDATIFYDYGSYHFYHGRRALLSATDSCNSSPPPPGQGVRRSAILTDSGAGAHRHETEDSPPRYVTRHDPCLPYTDSRQYEQVRRGVLQRTVKGPGLPDSVMSYTQYSFPFGENGNTAAQTLTVALLPADADGNRRAETTLFWAAKQVVDPGEPPVPGDRLGADIRHAVFESDPNPSPGTLLTPPLCGGSVEENKLCATHAIRVTRTLFQYDGDGPALPGPTDDGTLRRVRQTTTYYGHVTAADPLAADLCPGCLKHSVTHSLSGANTWEGNGRHYNRETHDGTLGGDRNEITTVWTPQSASHLLNLFSSRIETDTDIPAPSTFAGRRNTIDRSYFFDPTTGFLNGSLTWDAPTKRYSGDCRYPDAAGNVADEVTANVVSGTGAKPAANPCPAGLSSWAAGVIGVNDDAFGRHSGYAGGLLTSRRWIKDKTPLTWYASRADRDGASGWIAASYDSAGLATTFLYDSLGRVTSITPPGGGVEAPTAVSYDNSRQTTASRTGSDDSSWQRFLYDGLGRLVREIRQMPSGYAYRTHAFDPAGHEFFVSEWTSCSSAAGDCATGVPALGVTQSAFDPFGRPQRVAGPDGSVTTISFTDGATPYSDTRKAVTIENVGCRWNGVSCSGGSASTSAYRYDAAGRLVTALEPGGDLTTYSYDAAGKLASVAQGAQARTFAYDGLGYLLRETTPEGGAVDYTAVSGSTTYSNWGSLGNLRGRVDGFGSSTPVVRSFRYDAAGRALCEIAGVFAAGQTCDGAGLNLYVRNSYDGDGFPGGAYPPGRLTQRVGYNRILSPAASVTERFTYSNPAGRLSQQTTSVVIGSTSHSATQGWTYTSTGLVKTHSHPRSAGSFTAANAYSRGHVVSIAAPGQTVVRSATYNAAGALASWTAGNGVVTTITPDSSVAVRPSQIRTAGAVGTAAGGNFDSGLFHYDGAGNIVAIGADAFGYDLRSRLTSASYSGIGSETYGYDRYGNLLSAGSRTYCASTCANNRLPSPFSYDARGNLTTAGSETLSYDDLSRQIRYQAPGLDWRYLYGGASERVAKVAGGGTPQYTYRDETRRISTEYFGSTLGRDNMYLGNLLVASYVSSSLAGTPGWQFYASDHLGTPRLVTDLAGNVVESRKYWPYGDGVPANTGTMQKLRFCAMERDSENRRYYDHARLHDPALGRFASLDSVGGRASDPQSWNRYAYALGNPIKHVDPDGRLTILVHGTWASGSQTFTPGGRFFERVAASVHDRAIATFSWSGENSIAGRTAAARSLAAFIRSYKFAPGEKLNIIGHSHGGNVAIAAINLGLGRAVDNLVTLGTPVRPDYRLSRPGSVANFVALSSPHDPVQTNGGNSVNLPVIGEVGEADQIQPGATNVLWNPDTSPLEVHAALHEDPDAWTTAWRMMNLPSADQPELSRLVFWVHQ
ncbi:MAG: RHS repeat domain-containing protein [Acidobacteriota bacterium]